MKLKWCVQRDDGAWCSVGETIEQCIDWLIVAQIEEAPYERCILRQPTIGPVFFSLPYTSTVTGNEVQAITGDGYNYFEMESKTREKRRLWKRCL